MPNKPAKDINTYIAAFPGPVQQRLEKVRATIAKAAPRAEEAIKYAIPTFVLDGKNLIHFAAHKEHIGLYPAPRGAEELADELSKYEGGKGTLRFPHDEPLPLRLVARVVRYWINARRG